MVSALSKQVRQLPVQLRRSLTWDRGKEMADHKNFTLATDVQVYFCDPRSPWQRGSNENTNGLLRQYFPKGMDLSGYSQAYLNNIALRLNQRPRKTLGFETPADRLRRCCNDQLNPQPNSDHHAVSPAHNSAKQSLPDSARPKFETSHDCALDACNALKPGERESQRTHCHELHVEQLR